MPDPGDSHSHQGFIESTRRFCSLFSDWICSLTFKQLSELVKSNSSPSSKEEGSQDSMEIFDISSSSGSDYNLDLDSDDDQDVESVHKPSTSVPKPDGSSKQVPPSSFGHNPHDLSGRPKPNWKPRSSTNARDEGFQGQHPRATSGSGSGRPLYAGHRSPAESTASTSYGADRQAYNSTSPWDADLRSRKGIGSSSQSKKDNKNFDFSSSPHTPDATYGQSPNKRAFPSSFQSSGVGSKQNNSWDNLGGRNGKNGGFFQQVELNAAKYPNDGKDGPRILPHTLMRGKPVPSTQHAVSNDPLFNMGFGDDSSTIDERSIYQAALQDLSQPRNGQDLPEGVLTVPLLRHQKIALAWMVEKETNAMCVGGILADDQGLGKTISTIALIQMQRSLQRSEKHGKKTDTVALSIDDDEEEGNGKKIDTAKCNAEDICKTKPEILNLDDDDDDTGGAPKGSDIKIEDAGGSIGGSAVPTDSAIKIQDVGGLKVGLGAPTDSEIEDAGGSKGVSGASSSHQISSSQTFKKKRPAAGTLIVCPATVLKQWARELDEKVTKEQKLSVLVYHGGSRTKDPEELAKYDVVLTTYSLVGNEVPKQPVVDDDDTDQKLGEKFGVSSDFFANKKRKHPSGTGKKGKKGRRLDDSSFYNEAGTLGRVNWFRVVLDEAQTIKNHRTQTARACYGLRARRRWCLSGTPIQNSIDELFSYFRFLRHYVYSDYKEFCTRIKFPISRDPVMGYKKIQAVLKTLLLRRTKDTMLDGEPIINLPPKVINMKTINFTPEERTFYSQLEAESRAQFKAYDDAGTLTQNYASILLMILRLRQACDHPLLVKGFDSQPARRTSLEKARELPRRTLLQLLYSLEAASAICLICSDPAEDAVITICGHVFCYQCVGENLTGDDTTCPACRCKQQLTEDVLFSEATLRSCLSRDEDEHLLNDNGKSKGLSVLSSEYSSSKIKAALQILLSHCKLNNPSIELDDLEEAHTDNSMCAEVRTEKMENSPSQGPIKTIVFSQWTRMLDLFELSLNQYGIRYRRLDGSMSLYARDKAVREFNSDPEVTVMLMSLKAGNLGLNMVAACHVILLDLWWNPTTEDQAIDRTHRIGQTRTVTVSRMTVKDTIEDRILALQEEKRKMVASAFGEDYVGASAARLTIDDLKYLFMGSRGL